MVVAVGSEDGCGDEVSTGCADQGPSRPAAERRISGAPQAGGAGQDERPGHGEVRGLDLAAWPERQRADRMARRAVPLPDGALGRRRILSRSVDVAVSGGALPLEAEQQ